MYTMIWTAVLENGMVVAGTDGWADADWSERLQLYEDCLRKATDAAERLKTSVMSFTATGCVG